MAKGLQSEIIERLRDVSWPGKDRRTVLHPKDAGFGQSLVSQFDSKGWLSDAQIKWVHTLLERADNSSLGTMAPKPAEHAEIQVGNPSAIQKLFDKARKGYIEAPKVKFAIDGRVLSMKQQTAASPWSIYEGVYPDSKWVAGLDFTGKLSISRKFPAPIALAEFITQFAIDPSAAGRVMGQSCRWCCFCGKKLTTNDSKFYGYGPDCASRYGLEWGYATEHQLDEMMTELKALPLPMSGVRT